MFKKQKVLLANIRGKGFRAVKTTGVHCNWVNAKGIIRNCKSEKVIVVRRTGSTQKSRKYMNKWINKSWCIDAQHGMVLGNKKK